MIDADDVLTWIASSTGLAHPALTVEDAALLARVVGAVHAHVEATHTVPEPVTADVEQAIVMQSARLWQRRYSTSGIGAVNDFGPLRVTSLDPDVERLLAPHKVFAFS